MRERIGVSGSAGATRSLQIRWREREERIAYMGRDMGFVKKWDPMRGGGGVCLHLHFGAVFVWGYLQFTIMFLDTIYTLL